MGGMVGESLNAIDMYMEKLLPARRNGMRLTNYAALILCVHATLPAHLMHVQWHSCLAGTTTH